MTERKFEPISEATMYQARCTNCGVVEDDYDDYAGWAEESIPVTYVEENRGWLRVGDSWPPTELLCPKCQTCAVCGATPCYPHNDGSHAVCADHEDHEFAEVPA